MKAYKGCQELIFTVYYFVQNKQINKLFKLCCDNLNFGEPKEQKHGIFYTNLINTSL